MPDRRQTGFVVILAIYFIIVLIIGSTGNRIGTPPLRFLTFETSPAVKPSADAYARDFNWMGATKRDRQVTFAIASEQMKNEWRSFGVPRELQKPQILEQKGFVHLGGGVYIVDYVKVFSRNLDYFDSLTRSLAESTELPAVGDPLPEFLAFVQNITYEKPPAYYRNKFINSFFPPLVCLYEKYGDCDSKSLLLATFLAIQNPREKQALVLIRAMGISHAFLAVRRTPLPGMTSIFIEGNGYYIPVETSAPGWAPGFASERVLDVIRSGKFMFQILP